MLDTRRHDEVFNSRSFDLPVNIIGVGGVGSHVARFLAKLGVGRNSSITVFDGDQVESHNVGNQSYEPAHVGLFKVEALYEQYRRWSDGVEIFPQARFVTQKTPLSGIVFLCIDTMDARREVCEHSIWRNPDIKLLIETRVSVAHSMIFALDPNRSRHVDLWNEYWYPKSVADNDIGCSGPVSIVTAVSRNATDAVDSFLEYAKTGDAVSMVNRYCYEIASRNVLFKETWG